MKRFLLSVLFALLLMCPVSLFGCGKHPPITFSSILEIEADESGTRTMTAAADKKTLQALFHNSSFSFQSFISANCPKELEWSYIETASGYEMTFILCFDSLEHYQEQIAALTGIGDFTSVSRPKVGVKTGFTLSEKDDVMAVFSWFTNALMERTGMNESELAPYLSQQSNELVYNGRNFQSADGKLSCAAETILDAERIDILTELSLEQWKRRIYIVFPDELQDNASNVKSYLESMVPQGMEASWEDNTTWCLRFSASDFQELCILTSQLFQSSSKSASEESITAEDSLRIVHSYSEPLNLSFFVPDSGKTQARYFFCTDLKAALAVYDEAHTPISFPAGNDDYTGYRCLFDGIVSGSCVYNYDAVFQYQPEQIIADIEVQSIQLLTRTFTISLGEVPLIHQKLIFDTFSRDADGCGIVKLETDENNRLTLTFTQTGTPRFLTKGFRAVFHGDETLDYRYDSTDLFQPVHTSQFVDSLDFSGFLADPSATRITCRVGLPSGSSIPPDQLTGNLGPNESGSDSSYAASAAQAQISVSMTVAQPNTAYYLCLLALLAIVAAILYYIYEGLNRRR